MGNDPDREGVAAHFRHGETHSIDGNRTLVSEIAGKLRGHFKVQSKIWALPCDCANLCGCVDMTLNKMPSQPTIRRQRALEVDPRTGSEGFQICEPERFHEQVKMHDSIGGACDRKAATIHSHAVPDADGSGYVRRANRQAGALLSDSQRFA